MSRPPIDGTYTVLAQRLRAARADAGYKSASDASKKLGLSVPTILSHEAPARSNRVPKLEALRRYAELYGVTIEWLEGHTKVSTLPPKPAQDQTPDPTPPAANIADLPTRTIKPVKTAGIPILGTAQAGFWLEIDPLNQDSDYTIVDAPDNGNGRRFAIRVAGTSMNRRFNEGDIIICRPWSDVGRKPQDGDVLLVQRVKADLIETTIKAFKDGQLWPESTDPNWQKPVPIKNGDEVHIVALAVARYQPL